jgi:hypothetical protein
MSSFMDRAGQVGRGAWNDEKETRANLDDFTEADARLAAVMTRQDISSLTVLADDINVQLRSLRRTTFLLLVVVTISLLRELLR